MGLKRIDQVHEPVVGEFYLVPCVYGIWGYRSRRTPRWWPIIGPWHEDKALLNFPKHHYHLDIRFLSHFMPREIRNKETGNINRVAFEFSLPLQEWAETYGWKAQVLPDPVLKRRKYRRHMPEYPRAAAQWINRLEAAYQDHRLKEGMICPHRGAPLKGLQVDSDGCVTCPLHGLRWCVATGELVRTESPIQFPIMMSTAP